MLDHLYRLVESKDEFKFILKELFIEQIRIYLNQYRPTKIEVWICYIKNYIGSSQKYYSLDEFIKELPGWQIRSDLSLEIAAFVRINSKNFYFFPKIGFPSLPFPKTTQRKKVTSLVQYYTNSEESIRTTAKNIPIKMPNLIYEAMFDTNNQPKAFPYFKGEKELVDFLVNSTNYSKSNIKYYYKARNRRYLLQMGSEKILCDHRILPKKEFEKYIKNRQKINFYRAVNDFYLNKYIAELNEYRQIVREIKLNNILYQRKLFWGRIFNPWVMSAIGFISFWIVWTLIRTLMN